MTNKERVLGVVVNEQVMTYRFNSFTDQSINVVQHKFRGKDLVVVGSQEKNFITAYESVLADGILKRYKTNYRLY